MDCKSSSEPGHIFLKPKKPKVIERKVVKQRKSCNLEPIVPLHNNFNCRPQAVLKFEPLPPIRYYDPTCETHRLREAEKRALEKLKNRRLQRKLPPIDDRSNFTPPALDGRLHQKIQTEMYLEELREFRDERNNFTQTDLFIGRPPTPYFIPEKIGLDKQTQIYDGDLFDFDVEVQPVLEVLVGKLVEQALLEVQEEEELAALREQQRIFEEMRNAEFEEQQRLEEQERRIKQEKMERLRQEISRLKHSKLLEKKIAAVSFSEGYVGGLISSTFGDLVAGNYFYDDKEKDIEVVFMQNIVEKIAVSVTKEVLARKVLDDILRIVVKFRHDIFMMINSKDWEEDATEKENKKALRRAVLAESYDPTDIELTSILDIVSKTEIEREFVVNQIKNIFFLKHMPRAHLFAIADGLLERHVAANENIYTQGDAGDEFYIVKKGQFEVHANGMKVGTHDDSGYFGEMALMYNVQRRNTVKAATDGLLWYVKRSNFKQILTKSEHQARRTNVEFLKKVNIFKNMTETEFEKTADALRLVHFDNEEIIVKQGEKADSLMIIENGKALLTTVTESYPKGKEDYIETGAYFGELALLSEIVRSSTVTAVGDVYVLVLDADTFSRMVGNCHEIVSRAPPPTHKDKPKKARLAKEH